MATIHSGTPTGAMPIRDFCRTYGIGRTKAYDLINSGNLDARKCGKATLIDRASVERWYATLPSFDAGRAVVNITRRLDARLTDMTHT